MTNRNDPFSLLLSLAIPASLVLGCATVDTVPYCESAAAAPAVSDTCLAEPEVEEFLTALRATVESEAGPYLVRVAFDPAGSPGALCAERSEYGNPFHPRKALAIQATQFVATPAGARCLAGSSIVFNQIGAKRAEIQSVTEQCHIEAQPVGVKGDSPIGPGQHRKSRIRDCMSREQGLRGEIWNLVPGRIYVRDDDATERVLAIKRCKKAHEVPIAAELQPARKKQLRLEEMQETEACLAAEGWRPMSFDLGATSTSSEAP